MLKKFSLIVILFFLQGSIFPEATSQSFGSLVMRYPGNYHEQSRPYAHLLLPWRTISEQCVVGYQTELKVVSFGNGSGKLMGTEVEVSLTRYRNKKYLINDFALAHSSVKAGDSFVTVDRGHDSYGYFWIWKDAIINVNFGLQPLPEQQQVLEYYRKKFLPTYVFTAPDLDHKRQLQIELDKRFDIIGTAERMRYLGRINHYIGTVAQCIQETDVRLMTNLCAGGEFTPSFAAEDNHSFIVKMLNPPPEVIDCPIAMTFEPITRAIKWKQFEKQARAAEITLKPSASKCRVAGTQVVIPKIAVMSLLIPGEGLILRAMKVPEEFLMPSIFE